MKQFRDKIRRIVNDVIENKMELKDGQEINYSHPYWIIMMGIEHEKIHLETTSCLIRQLPLSVIKTKPESIFYQRELKGVRTLEEAQKIPLTYVEVPSQEVKVGRAHTGFSRRGGDSSLPLYGWDNEFGHH
jgi:hypothetical protein